MGEFSYSLCRCGAVIETSWMPRGKLRPSFVECKTGKTKEEADHSLPYMIAVALLDGQVTPVQYDAKRILKQDVQGLLHKVTIQPDKSMSDRFPAEMPCRLDIVLNSGRKLSIEKHDYEGFYTRPMPWDTVVAKFS